MVILSLYTDEVVSAAIVRAVSRAILFPRERVASSGTRGWGDWYTCQTLVLVRGPSNVLAIPQVICAAIAVGHRVIRFRVRREILMVTVVGSYGTSTGSPSCITGEGGCVGRYVNRDAGLSMTFTTD